VPTAGVRGTGRACSIATWLRGHEENLNGKKKRKQGERKEIGGTKFK